MTTRSQPMTSADIGNVSTSAAHNRWLQLGLGLVCMMAISSPQYVWTLMTKPLAAKLGVALPELQVTFSLLIILQTFFSPFQGKLIDRFGPRMLISIGTVMSGLSWVLAAQVQSAPMLYLTYGVVGGLGTGIVYVGVVGLMVRWFPKQRGFAAGAVAAGYGMGAIVTTFPIATSLQARGIDATLWMFGIAFALVGLLASQGLRVPPSHDSVAASAAGSGASAVANLRPSQTLKTPVFWLMFAMMTMMSTSGLMVTSQMATFAADFGVTKVLVFGMAALPLALTIDRFTNGLTRPLFGWVSDKVGRENTMFFAFALEGVAMALWLLTRERGAVRAAVGRGVLRLGRDFFAVPLDADRYLRHPSRHGELRLALYLARHRFDLRRPAGGADAPARRKLGAGVRHRDYARYRDRAARDCRAQADAPPFSRHAARSLTERRLVPAHHES